MGNAKENISEGLITSRFIPNPEESLFDPEDAVVGRYRTRDCPRGVAHEAANLLF